MNIFRILLKHVSDHLSVLIRFDNADFVLIPCIDAFRCCCEIAL